MGIADELQKLSDLLSQGILTNEEFLQAKTRLLSEHGSATQVDVGSFLEEQLSEVRRQNELARIDREWEIERRQYEIVGKYGSRTIPTIGAGVAAAVVGGVFGGLWTAGCFTLNNASHRFGITGESFGLPSSSFSFVSNLLPLFGVLFIVITVGRGLYCCLLAHNYNAAYRAYQQRHSKATVVEHEI